MIAVGFVLQIRGLLRSQQQRRSFYLHSRFMWSACPQSPRRRSILEIVHHRRRFYEALKFTAIASSFQMDEAGGNGVAQSGAGRVGF